MAPTSKPRRATTPHAGADPAHNYVERVSELRVELVNLSAAFHKEQTVPVASQLRPLCAALEQLQRDAAAFAELAEEARATATSSATPATKTVGTSKAAVETPANPSPAEDRSAVASDAPSSGAAKPVTLSGLSRRYGIPIAELRGLNPHLDSFGVHQPLPQNTNVTLRDAPAPSDSRAAPRTPGGPEKTPRPVTPDAAGRGGAAGRPSPAARRPPPQPAAQPLLGSTEIAGEDTVRSVASAHGVSVQELLAANPETLAPFSIDDALPPNLDLTIPAGRPVDDVVFANRGDTLEALSVDLRVKISTLRRANPELHDVAFDEPLPEGERIVVPNPRTLVGSADDSPSRSDGSGSEDGTGRSDEDGDLEGSEPWRSRGDVIRLRIPTKLEDVADDHGITVAELLALNAHRGWDNLSRGFRLPSGTYLSVPRA